MRRVALLLSLVAAAPAQAQDLTDELDPGPVYVAPEREDDLSVAALGRIRLKIVEQGNGRIKVAVLPPGDAQTLADSVDLPRAAILVVAGDELGVANGTGAQRAFARRGSLEQKILRAVQAVRVTPQATPPAATPDIEVPGLPDFEGAADDITDTVNDGLRFTFIAIVGSVVFVFLLVAFVFWRHFHTARSEHEDIAEDLVAEIEEQRVKLGEDIVDLDVATSMPDVDPEARAAYERALDAYDKSAVALKRADTHRRLQAVRKLVADGRADAARARAATGG